MIIGTPHFLEHVHIIFGEGQRCTCTIIAHWGLSVRKCWCPTKLYMYYVCSFNEIRLSNFHVYICISAPPYSLRWWAMLSAHENPPLRSLWPVVSQIAHKWPAGRLACVLLTNNTAVSNWHLSLRPYYIYCISTSTLFIFALLSHYCRNQVGQRGVAPADRWTEANGGLMEYKWRLSFLGWFARLVVPVWEIFILPWLLWSAQSKIFFVLSVNFFTLRVPIA